MRKQIVASDCLVALVPLVMAAAAAALLPQKKMLAVVGGGMLPLGAAALAPGRGSSAAEAAEAAAASVQWGLWQPKPREEGHAVLFNYLIFIAAAAPGPGQT